MYPSDICRVCMVHGPGMTSIFKPTVGTPIDIMIISITSINPLPYDGLPSQLCKYCLDMLQQCFAFRQRMIKSDIKFRQAQTPSNLLKSFECNKTGDIHSNSGNSALAEINLGERKGDSESLIENLFMSKDDKVLSNDISHENKQFPCEGVTNIRELQIVQVIGNYDVKKNSFEIDEHLRKIEFNTKQSEIEIKNDTQNEACFSKKASNNSSEQVVINKFQQKQLKSVTSPPLNINNINIQSIDTKNKNRQQMSTASFKNTIFETSEGINAVNHVRINTSQSSEESEKTSTDLLKSSKCNKGNSALAETNLPERGKDLESLTENIQIQNEDVTNIRELKIVQVIGDYNAKKNFFEIDEHLRKIKFSTKYGNMKSKESMKSMFSEESNAICINENKAKRQKVISTDLEIDLPRNNEISVNKLISQTDNVEVYNVKNTKQSDIGIKNDKQVIIEELQQNQLKSATSPPLENEKLKCIQGMNPKDKTTQQIITDFCKNKSFETSEDINEVNHLPINMSQSSGESDEVNISETDDNDSDYRPNTKISQKKKKPKSGRGLGRPKKLKTNEPNKMGKENTLEIGYNKSVKEGETKQYKKKVLSCNVCDFTCTKNIKRHMATHLIEIPHVCVKCNRTFARNDNLLRHERTCQGKRVIICEACNKTFELEAELNEHLNTEIMAERCQGLKTSKTISLENYTDPERLSKFYSIYFETENPVELTSEAIENNNRDNETLVQVNSDSDVINVVGNLTQSDDDYTQKAKATHGRKKRKVGRPRKQKIKIIRKLRLTSQSSEESEKTSTALLKSSKCNKGNSAIAETNLPERGRDLESLTESSILLEDNEIVRNDLSQENKQIQNEDVTNNRTLKIVQVIGDYNEKKNSFAIDEHLRNIEFNTSVKDGNIKSKESMKSMFSDESIASCINENRAKRQKVISADWEIDLPRNDDIISENKSISQTDNVEVYNVKITKQSDVEIKNDTPKIEACFSKRASNNLSKQVVQQVVELQQNQLKSVTSPLENQKVKCIKTMNPKDNTSHQIITDFCKNKSFEISEDINEANHLSINMLQSSGEFDEVNISETDDNDPDYRPNTNISQKKKKPKSGRGRGRSKNIKTNEPNKMGKENTLEIDYNKSVKEGEARQYKKKILSCNVCDFTCTKNIKRHMATHLIEKPHVCVKCNRTFARNDKLLRHERTCQGKPVIICEACNKTFELDSELNEHLNTEIVAERCQGSQISKTISQENYLDQERLSKLYSSHLQTENCVDLGADIENKNQNNEIRSEVNSHNDDYEPKVKTTCGRKKRKVGRPRKQKMDVIEDEIEPEGHYPCPVCSEVFTEITDLETHGKKCAGGRQNNEEPHQRKFTTAKALKLHMRKHGAGHNFVCSKCSKLFNSKSNLFEHMKFHAPERKFLCSICGLGFVRNDHLNVHMRRHREKKLYACQYCGKCFAGQAEVIVHERYHTGINTYVCTVCGRGFAKKYNLNVHMRTHTGEKPYQCTYCDVAFAQNSHLKLHVQRFTGDCFQCEICVAKFIMGCELIQHKQKVHGLNIQAKGPQTKTVKLPELRVALPLLVFTEEAKS